MLGVASVWTRSPLISLSEGHLRPLSCPNPIASPTPVYRDACAVCSGISRPGSARCAEGVCLPPLPGPSVLPLFPPLSRIPSPSVSSLMPPGSLRASSVPPGTDVEPPTPRPCTDSESGPPRACLGPTGDAYLLGADTRLATRYP